MWFYGHVIHYIAPHISDVDNISLRLLIAGPNVIPIHRFSRSIEISDQLNENNFDFTYIHLKCSVDTDYRRTVILAHFFLSGDKLISLL
jgi:hypothetical protein